MSLDPLAPDAPLIQLLSVRENPMLTTMTEEQLVALVRKLRQFAASPQTVTAADSAAGVAVSPKKTVASAKRAILDSL